MKEYPTAKENVVMSVGGSLIVPDAVDTSFLSTLKKFIDTQIAAGTRRFVLIAGGGKITRRYQTAAQEVGTPDATALDWIGLYATRLNGQLLKAVFAKHAYPHLITNPDDILDVPGDARLVIAAGHLPGASTDLRAVQIARHVGASQVINLSNTDYVYTADPNKDATAQRIETISWSKFRTLIPETWAPGLSSPFDPIAAREAEAAGIEVAHISGAHFHSLEQYLRSEPFVGTKIHP